MSIFPLLNDYQKKWRLKFHTKYHETNLEHHFVPELGNLREICYKENYGTTKSQVGNSPSDFAVTGTSEVFTHDTITPPILLVEEISFPLYANPWIWHLARPEKPTVVMGTAPGLSIMDLSGDVMPMEYKKFTINMRNKFKQGYI